MRAYLKNDKKYYYSDSGYGNLSIFFGVLEGYKQKGVEFILERATGVKDQENEEIYEGDIVQILYLGNMFGLSKSVKSGEVVFDSGCFLITNKEKNYYEYVGAQKISNCHLKIIGNKHEDI